MSLGDLKILGEHSPACSPIMCVMRCDTIQHVHVCV